MVQLLGLVLLSVVVSCGKKQSEKPKKQEKPPNIVFIFSDDHAVKAVSAYGSGLNKTPNIDRIADGGLIFENSFVTNSICAPSRASHDNR